MTLDSSDFTPPPAPPGRRSGGNLRSERARLVRGDDPDAAPIDAPERGGPGGPILTVAQRAIVLETIATFHDVGTVQEVLATEHPDIPTLSDRMIRHYRATTVAKDANKRVREARERALISGLALKATRIAHLSRMHDQLARVPIVQHIEAFDANGNPQPRTTVRLDVARERREILNQIAREMGLDRLPVPAPPPPGGEPLPAEGGVEADAARLELAEVLDALATRRHEAAAALAAAQAIEQAAMEAQR